MSIEIIKKLWKVKIIAVKELIVFSFLTVSCFCFISPIAYGSQTQLSEARRTSFLLSPDGRHLAYGIPAYNQNAEPVNRLMVCKSDGTEQREVATIPANGDKFLSAGFDEILWWGNDRLICSYRESLRYIVASVDGHPLSDITLPDGCDILYKRISPNSRRVAFVGSFHGSEGGRKYGLFVIELEMGRVRHLIDKALKTAPAWSGDSRKLAVGNSPGYKKYYPLVIVNVQTGEVSSTEAEGVGASWSPDDRFLAFTTETVRGGSWLYGIPMDGRIGVLNLVTGKLNHASPPAFNNRERETGKYDTQGSLLPVWSPDGQWIAYLRSTTSRANKESERNKSEEIWIVDKQGQNSRKILDDFCPVVWADDSQSLFVLKENKVDRIDTRSLSIETVVSWEKAQLPELPQADTIKVPQRFYICLNFNATRTKGVYVAYDQSVARSHSRLALPYTSVSDVKKKYDWMIRAHLCKDSGQ
jgi:Tol biopolymer transport system component